MPMLMLEDDCFYEGNTHLADGTARHRGAAGGLTVKITLYSSTQTPHYVHKAMTKVLGIPAAPHPRHRCTQRRRLRRQERSVQSRDRSRQDGASQTRPSGQGHCLTREEVFYCHRGRHPVQMHLKTGFTKDGKITAQHLKTALDGGAYGSYGVASTYYTGALQTVTYELPRYRFDSIRAFTNKPPCGPKRGHGTPQPRFGWESPARQGCPQAGHRPG